jgi:hypothetical protein
MADPGLSDASLNPAARRVIGIYLAELANQLRGPSAARAAILAELGDGLWTATAAHQAQRMYPEGAARAAVAEFGDPGTVAAGFDPELAAATGRRVGLGLLATGPLVGTSWLLLVAATWTGAGREPPAAFGLLRSAAGASPGRSAAGPWWSRKRTPPPATRRRCRRTASGGPGVWGRWRPGLR